MEKSKEMLIGAELDVRVTLSRRATIPSPNLSDRASSFPIPPTN